MSYLKPQHRLVILVLIMFGTACKKKPVDVIVDVFPVHSYQVQKKSIEETLIVSATLKAQNEATLFSRVPGKLKSNILKEGDRVKKDQTVALIERDEVGVTFEPAPVPSSLDGVVGRTYCDQGMRVGLDTPVALIVDDAFVVAKADIPEKYVGRISVGQRVGIRTETYPNQVFYGRVIKVSPVVSPATRTAPVDVELDNANRQLKSGMFVELTIPVARKDHVLTVPFKAVLFGQRPFVFIAKDGKAEKREVITGLQTPDEIEIVEGIFSGEHVITTGLFALKTGSPVDIVPDEQTKDIVRK